MTYCWSLLNAWWFFLGGGSAPLEWYSLWHFDILLDFLFSYFWLSLPHLAYSLGYRFPRRLMFLCTALEIFLWPVLLSTVLVPNLLSDLTLYSSLHPWVLETLPSQSSSSVLFLLTKLFMLVEYGFRPSPKTGIHAGKLFQSVSVWTYLSFFPLELNLMANLASEKLLDWIIFSQNFK